MKKQLLLVIFALFSFVNTAIYAQQPVCGGTFTDPAGATANYADNLDYTVTIYPNNPGDVVTVTFTSFTTEANWDALYVFNGTTISAPQIASNNPGNNVPGGLAGGYWGTAIPGPFTSTDASGCLTFRFRSDGSINMAGWVANVTCAGAATCATPTTLTATNITANSAVLGWTNSSAATSYEIIVVPCGSTAPTAATTGGIVTTSNPYVLTGLNSGTCYNAYVRGICSSTDVSIWSSVATFTTVVSCLAPTILNAGEITTSSAMLTWSNPGGANSWEVLTLPCNSPAPTATSSGTITSAVPYQAVGLTSGTCYGFYIRANCSPTDNSLWVGPFNFTTVPAPPVCGGTFTDNGSVNANYANNTDNTVTICPAIAGEVVTVYFSSFSTEANYDALYVFDGNSIASPQISSLNPAADVPGGLAGGFWGTTIPSSFTSTSVDGCLTFRFRSDSSVNMAGWVAPIECSPPPTCIRPTALFASATTSNSLTIGWTENSGATSWEIITLPCGSVPTSTSTGIITSSNPYTTTGLNSGTCYASFVRSICSSSDVSNWSLNSISNTNFTIPANDECLNAIVVPVNYNSCSQITAGILSGSTASIPALAATCVGTADDDVWFVFVATNTTISTSVQNVVGTSQNLNQALYSGGCGNLVLVNCSSNNMSGLTNNGLTVGDTYYLRVFSNLNTPPIVTFNLCVSTQPSCEEAQSICGVNNYVNTTGVPNMGTIGCLYTTANPAYFSIKIAASGSINMLLTQTSMGSAVPNLDVDYVAWGPFSSQSDACTAISAGAANLTGLTTGCSYSALATEQFNIANAIAGEYYIILITNFSGQAGFINIVADSTSTGSIDCSGSRLNAFIDTNGNGTQESGEQNFPLGQFHYEVNNDSSIHNITSPSGIYTMYDISATNTYDLGYSINSNYTAMYSTTANFTDVAVVSGGMTTYNFPITITQTYNDLAIIIVPDNAPRTGTTYKNKIIYTNLGNQTLANGTLTFNNNAGTTITTISQSGTTNTTNGFTYNFTNLLPFESRMITVTMSVPPIPTVFIGQLLTNSASIIPPSGDIVTANNSSVSSQIIIGAYDPNDKTESHGDKILFSSFAPNDYLHYTIRFENTGTASALNVVVNDILDSQLDENTLIMTGNSHSYTLDRMSNNLSWNFENIQLPVSVVDTNIGKGYITFKIKLKPGFGVGDVIPNTAFIYFDSNPAIVTNTFNTEFVAVLSNAEFTNENILLFPNPTSNSFQISIQNTTENLESIVIYDVLGKIVKIVEILASSETSVDVSHLSKGVYLVEVISENKLKLIKKLVIQ